MKQNNSKDYTSKDKRFCSVYKSLKKQEMYLYVDRKEGLKSLPDELMTIFREPAHVLDMILTPQKSLARVDAQKVLDEIAENGFYLQMPPVKDDHVIGHYPAPKDTLNG